MNINATLFGEMIIFALFIYLTYRWVWPYIITALDARQQHIAAGIAAADKSLSELAATEKEIAAQMQVAKRQAHDIIDESHKRAGFIIDEAKDKAKTEGKRLLEMAQSEIAQSAMVAKQGLRAELAKLTLMASERILSKQIDQNVNNQLVEQLIAELDR